MSFRIIRFVFLSWLSLFGLSPQASSQEGPSAYVGDWSGDLSIGPQKLEIGFTFTLDEGKLSAVMHSPKQGAFDIPASVALSANDITISVKSAGVSFTGALTDADTLKGTFSQNGAKLPLTVKRQDQGIKKEALNRPQTPQPPFNYVSEDIKFAGGDEDVILAGTLTKPKGNGPFPAIITITGSGPHDRDETILGHKPFLVIADHLTKAGFAVLRYDDRGTAKSTGDFNLANSADFAEDANAAVAALIARDDIDPDRISLLGHSEGGIIAPLVAKDNANVSALILLAPPVDRFVNILATQLRFAGAYHGLSEEEIQANVDSLKQIAHISRSTQTAEEARQRAIEILDAANFGDTERERQLRTIKRRTTSWYHFLFNHDPAETLKKINVPVLALFGEKDFQVSINNQVLFEQIKKQKAAKAWKSKIFPGHNHLFQKADTGAATEYGKIEETTNPVVLDYMEDWITRVQKP